MEQCDPLDRVHTAPLACCSPLRALSLRVDDIIVTVGVFLLGKARPKSCPLSCTLALVRVRTEWSPARAGILASLHRHQVLRTKFDAETKRERERERERERGVQSARQTSLAILAQAILVRKFCVYDKPSISVHIFFYFVTVLLHPRCMC